MAVPTLRFGGSPSRRSLRRVASSAARGILAASAAAAALTLASPQLGGIARGAQPADGSAQKKAVIVVGPVGGLTSLWLRRGEAVAEAAERNGMQVVRIFHPNATWARVVAEANGADLFVYLGHGNGWPSPHPPFQEDTKDGLGLDPRAGVKSAGTVRYVGADHIVEEIHFAPNAIVILNKACYSAGNGEEGAPIPERAVAVRRVDNYAAGFLAAGARTVFALTWQPPGDLIDALYDEKATMEGLFRMRFGQSSGSVRPYFGWVGWRPDLVVDSQRTPGARLHLDPEPQAGYLRAVSGDLDMTTQEWRGSSGPPPTDTTPPELTDVRAQQAANTITAGEGPAAVFTPNGDGLSERLTVRYSLSEPAWVDVAVVRAQNGKVVRHMGPWRPAGEGHTVWDGRTDAGGRAPDGKYRLVLTPRDRAGNAGEARKLTARVLTALRAPGVTPALFDPTDGDALAAEATFRARLIKSATVGWRILAADGSLERVGGDGEKAGPGRTTFTWDGRDDAGQLVPPGTYTASVSARTGDGEYAHTTTVQVGPFELTPSAWTVRRGQTTRLVVDAAEAVVGTPVISVKQPGRKPWEVKVRRVSDVRFIASLTTHRGGPDGQLKVTVTSTDTAGGTQSQTYALKLR